MGAIRSLIKRYPVAAIAVAVAVAGLGGWTFYQSQLAQEQPPPRATAPAITPPIGTPVTPTRGGAAAPVGPAGSAPAVTPTSPNVPASRPGAAAPGQPGPGQGVTSPGTAGEGRANPFEPLVAPPGSNPAPGAVTIPPVPPLAPTGAAGPGTGTAPPVSPPPAYAYRVVGFLWGDAALAILEDGQGSYIVGPGDTVKPGVRVVAIDVRREIVRLDRDGTAVELTLPVVRRSP